VVPALKQVRVSSRQSKGKPVLAPVTAGRKKAEALSAATSSKTTNNKRKAKALEKEKIP
jgi:hypothetical protein